MDFSFSRSDSSLCTVSPTFIHRSSTVHTTVQTHAIDRSAPFDGRGDAPRHFFHTESRFCYRKGPRVCRISQSYRMHLCGFPSATMNTPSCD